ncbi:site-specific DNA-methyltransferase [Bifidobacterium pseudolongum]|uniref:Methyltransferase n=1 Tax=Bifidobacterium pseudolongum TaxID=1694 RepID=A0A4S4F587_9BIFI|nr:DNA methyltransferase [Bifidobacterium pseudolongum]MCH4852736.1 site-specific DNA-methyltransferase [Bifidobacterium pseudolongum]THG24452.1 site-specific DNA-methyltransferase [Bifidobacterium pseudolongum]
MSRYQADRMYELHHGNVSEMYDQWPSPDLIVSDGAYGVRGFRGDTTDTSGLVEWYKPHALAWAKAAKPSTSLWFWNTEVGWATVHPLLLATGWEYVQLAIWDKGLAHIAGNVNGKTIRQLPVVTEVAALYRRKIYLETGDGQTLDVKSWLRAEWQRSGLPFYRANEACGVKNAATRKYLTKDWLWYWPPGDAVAKMARYCMEYGMPTVRPYFSLDGKNSVNAEEWDALRATWNHRNGITNVWSRQPLADKERLKGTLERNAPRTYKPTKQSAAHLNQKPLDLMLTQVSAASNAGDTIWEPFGGLASAAVASVLLGRRAFVAEIDDTFVELAGKRLAEAEESFEMNGAYTFPEA